MTPPRSRLLAFALPAAALVLVDWVFWGLRADQAGFGVNVDGLALLTAFIVALASAGLDQDENAPASVADAMLQRVASAGFGLLAASMCGAVFAWVRLDSIVIGPTLESEPMSTRFGLVALALVVAPLLVWLGRHAVLRLSHPSRIVIAVLCVALSGWLTLRPHDSGARLEYLSAEFRTAASLGPMTLDVRIEPVTIANAEFEYLAVANNCVLRPKHLEPTRRVAAQSVAIPAGVGTAGFAVCPTLHIYDAKGQIYGTIADRPAQKPLFRVVGGRLTNDPVIDGLNMAGLPTGEKVGVINAIRAPLATTVDRDEGDGILIKRDASGLERCTITVLDGDRLVREDQAMFGGSGNTLGACKPVTVKRAPSLGIVNVDIPDSDMSTGTPEPSSVTWLDGESAQRIALDRVASRVEVPKAWRAGALAGFGFGALCLIFALVELARLRRLRGFVAAQHQGAGKLALGDDAIVDAEAARELEVGEVFVRGELPEPRLPGYRESAQATARALEVRAPAEVHRAWDRGSGRVTFASAIAIAFPLATSALMLAARVFGLGD